MAEKVWEKVKIKFCDHAGCDVALEVQMVYPPDVLPDQPPRLVGHRCSHGKDCMLNYQGTCVWSGTNPDYDPFTEK